MDALEGGEVAIGCFQVKLYSLSMDNAAIKHRLTVQFNVVSQ